MNRKKRTPRNLPFLGMGLLLFAVQITIPLFLCQSSLWAANPLKIGLLEEPKTVNIWMATDSWSHKVLNLIYQPLYIREPRELRLIPWLAEKEPFYDEGSLSYTIKIREAKWSDGSAFTSEDVAFTGEVIREFKIPRYYSNWKFIKAIETPDRHTVRFRLAMPKAIFLSRTLTTPIVQKKEWESSVNSARGKERPLSHLLKHRVETPVGTGPFVLKEWRQGAYLYLTKNKHFFAQGKEIEGHCIGPYIDGLVFKVFGTTDAAILALKRGTIDMFWWGIQPGYLQDLLDDKNIETFSNEKSALYYLGFNLRKKPFSDLNFRRAVATLIDKDFIVQRILQGYAVKMHSIVPPGNRFWHTSDTPSYGESMGRDERIRTAYEMLQRAGYTWKKPPVEPQGKIGRGEGIIEPDGRPMERFTILTPPADYDPHRAMVGIMVQEWLRMVGIPAFSKPMAFSALTEQVKMHRQFDLFVLGYGQLSLDPDYLRNFFHSSNDKPGGWNMSGYRNAYFDRIADRSADMMDVEKRRQMVREMQSIIMHDIPYFPLYNPKLIEGTRKDRFTGWVQMIGGVGNTWSFCTLRPND